MSAAAEQRVRLQIEGHVADVALNRPEKHNALDLPMFEGISAVLEQLAADASIRAIVLHGEGRSFCSGLDFPSFMAAGMSVEKMLGHADGDEANLAQRVAYGWQRLPAPVVAAVHGNCIGGGAQIALAADVRLLAPDARISIRETHWGLIPDMGLTRSLPRLVRFDLAKELVLTARMVEATEAVEIGLGTRLEADPLAAAHELAGRIAALSPDATRRAKLLLEQGWSAPAADSLALEERLQRKLLGSPNQIAAVQAGFSGEPASFDDPS